MTIQYMFLFTLAQTKVAPILVDKGKARIILRNIMSEGQDEILEGEEKKIQQMQALEQSSEQTENVENPDSVTERLDALDQIRTSFIPIKIDREKVQTEFREMKRYYNKDEAQQDGFCKELSSDNIDKLLKGLNILRRMMGH